MTEAERIERERREFAVFEVDHSPACQWETRAYQARRAAWALMHPHACETCSGYGGAWSSYDPSPAGVSLSPGRMDDFDPCPDCYEQGRCAICGGPLPDEERSHCSDACEAAADARPAEPEFCPCYVEQMAREEAEAAAYWATPWARACGVLEAP